MAFSYDAFNGFLNGLLLICAVLHPLTLPFSPRLSLTLYRNALICAIVIYGSSLYRTKRHMLKFSLVAIQQIMAAHDAQYLFNTLFFLVVGYVNPVFPAPLCIYASYVVVTSAERLLKPVATQLEQRRGAGESIGATGNVYIMAWNRMRPISKWLMDRRQIAPLQAAGLEVMQGFWMLLGAFAGGSFLNLLVYWNFLSHRYHSSRPMKMVFSQFRAKLDGWFLHPRCPGLIGNLWRTICGLLEKASNFSNGNYTQPAPTQ
eukprot:NODE_2796_length_990_cov_69.631518_g2776_i0.p1 GENE.NODE_2796_length_990_cov_69.631518_g2776_i0~~NODE_2796_length_990_cov_69.631518_g2776_i0.p1  ORF type:complete len:260 (+),score=16.52 NODE_2796_length_990_cov_69.631518_g2776_i0:62-841(+)